IRPTDVSRRPQDLSASLTPEQYKLYDMIWRRFVACQMPPSVWKVTEAKIVAKTPSGEAIFKAMGRRLVFDGFMVVAGRPKRGEQLLPHLEVGQAVAPVEITPLQRFTQPPPRYTEASLVKALEADGIGRPSTYATIIQTIQDRKYVRHIDRAFHPTDLGIVVTDKLVKHFPRIFDVRFTAHMEDELDKIEESRIDWVRVLEDFYGPFSDKLKRASKEMVHAKAETKPSNYVCEACGRPMVYRFSANGRYLACTGYPKCKQTHPVDKNGRKLEEKRVDIACPKCGKQMVLRRGRYGPFLSCSEYPGCDGVVNLDRKGSIKRPTPPPLKVDLQCPKCQSPLNLRRGKRGPWLSCSKFPKCRGRAGWRTLSSEKRKELEARLTAHEEAHPQQVIRKLDGTPIGEQRVPQAIGEQGPDEQAPRQKYQE
ncbi:MAG: DNA topoisomerase, partial [Planctomycetota bacterium]